MKYFIKGNLSLIILSLTVAGIATAQQVQMGNVLNEKLIPGQIAVYFEDGVTPEQAKRQFSDLDLTIVKTDIAPARTVLHNPDIAVIEQIKNHPTIEQYEIMTFVHDSTTLKNLKLADDMTEEQKEKARKKFLERKDQTMLFISFKDKFTSREAESVLSGLEGIGHFNMRSSPRIVYVEVKEGTEPEQMEQIRSLPFVTDVVRMAEAIAENE